jgi:hypothetical protein
MLVLLTGVVMKYTVELASDDMIFVSCFMRSGFGIQVILRSLPRQFEELQYWYYYWVGLMMSDVEMTLGDMTHTVHIKFHGDRFRNSSNINGITY